MIKPTVGRIVWYHPTSRDTGPTPLTQPLAAIVSHVHSDTLVNLSVFDANGSQYSRTSVTLVQGDEIAEIGQCEWMPFQKGQAVKAESLEDGVKDRIAALESAVHAHANTIMSLMAMQEPKEYASYGAEKLEKASA